MSPCTSSRAATWPASIIRPPYICFRIYPLICPYMSVYVHLYFSSNVLPPPPPPYPPPHPPSINPPPPSHPHPPRSKSTSHFSALALNEPSSSSSSSSSSSCNAEHSGNDEVPQGVCMSLKTPTTPQRPCQQTLTTAVCVVCRQAPRTVRTASISAPEAKGRGRVLSPSEF